MRGRRMREKVRREKRTRKERSREKCSLVAPLRAGLHSSLQTVSLLCLLSSSLDDCGAGHRKEVGQDKGMKKTIAWLGSVNSLTLFRFKGCASVWIVCVWSECAPQCEWTSWSFEGRQRWLNWKQRAISRESNKLKRQDSDTRRGREYVGAFFWNEMQNNDWNRKF